MGSLADNVVGGGLDKLIEMECPDLLTNTNGYKIRLLTLIYHNNSGIFVFYPDRFAEWNFVINRY